MRIESLLASNHAIISSSSCLVCVVVLVIVVLTRTRLTSILAVLEDHATLVVHPSVHPHHDTAMYTVCHSLYVCASLVCCTVAL